jgi:hypothetical protein
MIQENIAQLLQDCQSWRNTLRQYRDEFHNYENRIREVASKQLNKEQLLSVEHLHNQFDIQLLNIHDLKKALKTQEQLLAVDSIPEDIYHEQESLQAEYESLIHTLEGLKSEFNNFLAKL